MARAIWQGSINFGLVEIPVALVSAEKPHDLDLAMLDRRDFSPIGYRRYNKATQEEVEWNDIVRGFEHSKGEFVVLSEAELRRANPKLTQTVDILHFVDADAIEPIYFEKPYYLAPQRKNSRSYALFRETLKRARKLGIARIVVHTREHLAAVGEREGAIVLYLLRFADEIRPPSELENLAEDGETVKVTAKEIAMAGNLVAEMTDEWHPESLVDEYSRDVMRLVEQKVKTGQIHEIPSADDETERSPREGKIIDLMPLLQKSIETTRRSEAAARPRSKAASRARASGPRSRRARRSA